MEYITLNNRTKMPLEGFGVFQIPDAAECEEVTYNAIKTGYRLIDTAAAYMNETAVGKAIARAIADGIVKREDLFITTKVWVSDQKMEKTAYQAVKTSLEKLNLSYVDLILLHQPMGDYFAAYRGITEAYRDGLVKAVGVANFYTGEPVRKCGGHPGSQPGRTAPVLPAGRRTCTDERVRRGASGMGAAGRRKTRHLYGSGADKDRREIRKERRTGSASLECRARGIDYPQICSRRTYAAEY